MRADTTVESPIGVAEDGAGNVYLLDANTSRIEKYTASGRLIGRWGFGTFEGVQPDRSRGLSVDGAGSVYMLDAAGFRIQKYSPSGRLIGAWGFGTYGGGIAGSSRPGADAPAAHPMEAAPAPAGSSPAGTEMTPDAGLVEALKQTPTPAPAVDMVTSTVSGVASAPGAAAGRGAEAVMTAASNAASASEPLAGRGTDAVRTAASNAAPIAETAGRGVEKIRTAASDTARERGDRVKHPLRSGEAAQPRHHWWQFWK